MLVSLLDIAIEEGFRLTIDLWWSVFGLVVGWGFGFGLGYFLGGRKNK